MLQNINLYQLEKVKVQKFSFHQMVQFIIVLSIILFGLTIYEVYSHWVKQKNYQELSKKQAEINKQLMLQTGKVSSPQSREEILKEIKALEEEKIVKQDMLATLIELQTYRTIGFSRYLKALAESTVPDLWLTQFQFQGNGDYISLEGNTMKPDNVPLLMERLSKETVFSGKTFQVFKITSDKKTDWLHFELETNVSGGGNKMDQDKTLDKKTNEVKPT